MRFVHSGTGKIRALSGAVAVALFLSANAVAQPPSAADSIHARKVHYKEIGGAMKHIIDELKKASPSVPTIQGYARQIDALAPQVMTWFPAGSGSAAGLKTAAKVEIWTKPDEFRHDAQDFAVQAHRFDEAAATGDLAKIHTVFPALGQTCKTCHEEFRVRED